MKGEGRRWPLGFAKIKSLSWVKGVSNFRKSSCRLIHFLHRVKIGCIAFYFVIKRSKNAFCRWLSIFIKPSDDDDDEIIIIRLLTCSMNLDEVARVATTTNTKQKQWIKCDIELDPIARLATTRNTKLE